MHHSIKTFSDIKCVPCIKTYRVIKIFRGINITVLLATSEVLAFEVLAFRTSLGSDRTTVASTLAGIAQAVASEYQNISHKKISPSRPLSLSGGRAGAAALAEVNGAPLRVADTR